MENQEKNAYEELADKEPVFETDVNPTAFNVDINKVVSFEDDDEDESGDEGEEESGKLVGEFGKDGSLSNPQEEDESKNKTTTASGPSGEESGKPSGDEKSEGGEGSSGKPKGESGESEEEDDSSSGSGDKGPDASTSEEDERQNLEEKYKKYSEPALIAISEIKDGNFPIEEDEVPEDLDAYQLRNLYRLRNQQEVESIKKNVYSRAKEAEEFVKYLTEGGNPEVVKKALSNHELTKIDVDESEENQRKVIRALYERKDMPKEDVDELVESIFDRGKNKERAKQAQEIFREEEKNTLKEAQKQEEEQRKAAKQREKEYNEHLMSLIETGEVGGVKLNESKKEQLKKDIFEPTEIIEVVNPNTGEKQRVKATKNQVLQQKIQRDPKMFLAFNLWLSEGGNFDFAKKQAYQESDDQMRSLLEGRKNTTRKEEKLKSSGNAWEDLAEW